MKPTGVWLQNSRKVTNQEQDVDAGPEFHEALDEGQNLKTLLDRAKDHEWKFISKLA